MFHLDWYRMFHRTAKTGSLTKAAQQLFLTQPSVSYAIKQMETALGVTLFHRLPKGVELTAEGRELFAFVEQSLALLDAGEQRLGELKRLAGGELRIGASDSLVKHLLLPQLEAFRAAYPGVRIRLSHGRSPEIAQRLKDGRIDLGLVHLPADDPQLDVRPLAAIAGAFVAGEPYRELAGRPLAASELGALPLLLLSPESSTRRFLERWFAVHGVTPEADIELGSIDLLIELARRGFGVAFVTRSFVAAELEAGSLVELTPAEPPPERTVGLAVRRGLPLSAAAERFAASLLGTGPSRAEPGPENVSLSEEEEPTS
ncbi:LysR family transcriptional regulator [Paenibacillus sp. J31TS4]|uniref:LysR family transcriptional regulator n=1 Tax=Paenibacillus sp. J31TS4 TaxID=2807195 RepID=UPI001B030AF9|nr:LysR family transcriptional regulator [Paenibacillus sp. J31TS4]GIP39351.1 LysR family transcriptional regulator [Paenibacillus sp. J31TS4]